MKGQPSPAGLLAEGCTLLRPVLQPAGFRLEITEGSSDAFATGRFVREDRVLELHVRRALGLVIYHVGAFQLTHEAYMRSLGVHGEAEFPGFSPEPLDGFRHLARDLARHADDFLEGPGIQLRTFAQENQKAPDRFRGLRGVPRTRDR